MLLDMQERLLRTEAVLGMAPSASATQLVDPDADDIDSESDSASESSRTAAPDCNNMPQQHAVPQLALLSAVDSPQEAQAMLSCHSHQQNAAIRQDEDEATAGLSSHHSSHHQELDMTLSASDEEVQVVGTCALEDQAGVPFTSQTDGATTLLDGFSQQRDESKDQPAQLLPAIVQPASPHRSAANAAAIKKPKGRFKGFFRFRPANNRFL